MTENPDTSEIVNTLLEWLDKPERHLAESSRREVLEDMVNSYAERLRRKEAAKTRIRDWLLYGSIGTTLLTLALNSNKFLELLL